MFTQLSFHRFSLFPVLILVSFLLSCNVSATPDEYNIHASKILVNDPALARKIAISFHHAILEVDYQKGFIVADLSPLEIKKLTGIGLKIERAADWNQQYSTFRQFIKQKHVDNKTQAEVSIPGFECYPTVEETLQQGSDLASSYTQLAQWIDIGDSWEKINKQSGFDLMVLKITNSDIVEDKPKLFIHSSMHAREYTPAALTLDFAKQLLARYQSDPDIHWIIDHHEIHILFQMNPDGRKVAETGVLQRKNRNDNHCPQQASSGAEGVDLNRNFAFFWNTTTDGSSANECDQTYRGISPESEPETQAVSNYIRSLFADSRGPNLQDAAPDDTAGMHIDIHSYSQLVLWPYGHVDSSSPNDAGFVALGNKLAWFNGYTPQQSIGLYPTDGTSDDVSYGELGIAAFTFELGTAFFQPCSDYENKIKPDNLDALIYAAKVVRAPYLLGFGPEITSISLNDNSTQLTVSQGTQVDMNATADNSRTQLSFVVNKITRAEYSIDDPIWLDTASIFNLQGNDGDLSSPIEELNSTIDTTNLSVGRHTIYVRAYNQDDKVGVPSAIFLNISDNTPPSANFTFNCDNLDCSFDASTSSDSDGEIVSYQWDFGDGVTAIGVSSQHIYSGSGDKVIHLTITDNSNNISATEKNLTITSEVDTAPAPQPASSSGGGSMSILLLIFIIVSRKQIRK